MLRAVPGRRARRECARAAEPSPHDAKAGAAKMQFRHALETPPRPLLSRIKCVSYYCGEEKGKKSARKGGKGGVLFRGTGAGAAARKEYAWAARGVGSQVIRLGGAGCWFVVAALRASGGNAPSARQRGWRMVEHWAMRSASACGVVRAFSAGGAAARAKI